MIRGGLRPLDASLSPACPLHVLQVQDNLKEFCQVHRKQYASVLLIQHSPLFHSPIASISSLMVGSIQYFTMSLSMSCRKKHTRRMEKYMWMPMPLDEISW